MTSDARRNRTRILIAFAAVYLIWGSTYLAIKYAVETIPPFMTGAARFLVSGAVLYAIATMRGSPRPRWGDVRTAIITGDRLTTWDVKDDTGAAPPLATAVASGASDPLAISLEPFERQFRDFGEAITRHRKPLVAGEEGLEAIEIVDAIYRSCRTGERQVVSSAP